jgi:hypothetical protein
LVDIIEVGVWVVVGLVLGDALKSALTLEKVGGDRDDGSQHHQVDGEGGDDLPPGLEVNSMIRWIMIVIGVKPRIPNTICPASVCTVPASWPSRGSYSQGI